jgi:hypothetical protein
MRKQRMRLPRIAELMQEGDDFVDMVKFERLLRRKDPYKMQQRLPAINHHYDWGSMPKTLNGI